MTKDNVERFLIDYVTVENQERADAVRSIPAVEKCGKYSRVIFSPLTGKPVHQTFYCKNFRDCEECGKRRENEFLQQMEYINEQYPDAFVTTMSEKEWSSLKRHLNGDYMRYPVAGNEVVLIHNSQEIAERKDTTFALADVTRGDLVKAIYKTPPRKRTTGTLSSAAKKADDDDNEEEVEVEVLEMIVNTTNSEDIDKIFEKCTQEDDQKQFETVNELQNAIWVRQRRFIYWANEFGFYLAISHKRCRKVKLSKVRW